MQFIRITILLLAIASEILFASCQGSLQQSPPTKENSNIETLVPRSKPLANLMENITIETEGINSNGTLIIPQRLFSNSKNYKPDWESYKLGYSNSTNDSLDENDSDVRNMIRISTSKPSLTRYTVLFQTPTMSDEESDLQTKYFQIHEFNETGLNGRIPKPTKGIESIHILKETFHSQHFWDEAESSKKKKLTHNSTSSILSINLLREYLREEDWVIPILVVSVSLAFALVAFEVYVAAKLVRSRKSHRYPIRRNLFLGQTLMLGLFLCCGSSIIYTLKPSVVVCSLSRIILGLSYSMVFATILVKLVFLISINSGVYLPTSYQSLLLSFAIIIQVVIGIQWLVSNPAKVELNFDATNMTNLTTTDEEPKFRCNITFHQELFGLLYIIFLLVMVFLMAFKARGIRENFEESKYIGVTMACNVFIFIVWIFGGLMGSRMYQDVCLSCGVLLSAAFTFIFMFLPKGRRLSAIGRGRIINNDTLDVQIGSESSASHSTTSSNDSGIPSPSFFSIKP